MGEIVKLSNTHEMLMNWLLCNPDKSLRECADAFGYTQSWVSSIIHSDIFQNELAKRQENIRVKVADSIPEKLRRAGDLAVEKLTEVLEHTEDGDFILDATDKILHRLGYAPQSSRAPGGSVSLIQQNNVVVASQGDLAEARALMAKVGMAQSLVPPLEGEVLPLENQQ